MIIKSETIQTPKELEDKGYDLSVYCSTASAAKLLGYNEDTVRRACKKGVIPAVYLAYSKAYWIPVKVVKDEEKILNNPKLYYTSKKAMEELEIPAGIYHQYLRRGHLKPVAGKYLNYHWKFYRFKKEDVLELKNKRIKRFKSNPERFKHVPKVASD